MTVSQYGGGPKAFAACQPLRPPPNRDDDHVSMPTDPGKQKARDRHSPRTCTSNFVHVVRVDVAVVPAKRRADHEIGEVERVNQRHRIGPHTLAVLNDLDMTPRIGSAARYHKHETRAAQVHARPESVADTSRRTSSNCCGEKKPYCSANVPTRSCM